jgi:hypothetical protein
MKYRTFCAVPVRQTVLYRNMSGAFKILVLATFVVMFAGYEGHGAAYMLPPTPEKTLTLSQFVAGIITRSADLNYVTEQDSEVFAFYRNTPAKEMTNDVFLALLRRPGDTQIVRQSWSTFFQIRTQNDPTGRWGQLQEYLEANLKNPTVFRLPRGAPYGAQYDLYAVGIFNAETVVGVQMFGVAT